MNAAAKKEIARLCKQPMMPDEIAECAMRWAYKDASALCRGKISSQFGRGRDARIATYMACAYAIEQRAK